MSDLDTFSDAQLLMKSWWKTLRLQEDRLTSTPPPSIVADSHFAVIACASTVQCCALFDRFGVPGVRSAIDAYRARQPAAKSLRNALEHFDEYLLGDGGRGSKRVGRVWFPFRHFQREGRAYMRIPPLPETPFALDFDVTQLIADTLWLHTRVAEAIETDFLRRMGWREGDDGEWDPSRPAS